jgi:WD40 repeat protein
VLQVVFLPDGHHIATGDLLGFIRIWNLATTKMILEIPPHSDGRRDIYASRGLAVSPDGRFLANLTSGERIRVWELKTLLP